MADMRLIEGFLEIPLRGGKTHLVEELSCSSYEIFMKSWILMLTLNRIREEELGVELSFFELLTTDEKFRACVVTALELLGIEEPLDVLTPRQVKKLFINSTEDGGDGVGFIFKLHGSSPKVSLRQSPAESLPRGSKNSSVSSPSLTGAVSPHKRLWATLHSWINFLSLNYFTSGLCLAI